MDILTLLSNHEQILIDDVCENRKTRKLINEFNSLINEIIEIYKEFKGFKEEQLEGSYHKKLVMAKSLLLRYGNWPPMVKAFEKIEKEERNKVDKYYSSKDKALALLNKLLKDSAKLPIVSKYDVFDKDFVQCAEGHNVVILGNNNSALLKTLIEELNINLQVKGLFEQVESIDLPVNYTNVYTNVTRCQQSLDAMYSNNPSKYEKLKQAINKMEEIAKGVVVFSTYKDDLANVGVSAKDLDIYEKNTVKDYMPYKNLLRKAFNIQFEEINDLVVDEDLFKAAEVDGFTPTFNVYTSSDVTFNNQAPNPNTNAQYTEPTVTTYQEPVTSNPEPATFSQEQVATQSEQPVDATNNNEQVEQPEQSEQQTEEARPQSRFGKVFDRVNQVLDKVNNNNANTDNNTDEQ